MYIIALYIVTLALTPLADNVNYVYQGFEFQGLLQPLDPFLTSTAYVFLWPIGLMFLAWLGYEIQVLLYRLTNISKEFLSPQE